MKGGSILVLRADDLFSAALRSHGFGVINLPLITTKELADLTAIRSSVSDLERYDGVIFTSPAAAEVFVREANSHRTSFLGVIYALGNRSRVVLESSGWKVRSAAANTAEEMISEFGVEQFTGKKLLYVRGETTTGKISEAIGAVADLDEVIVYRTRQLKPGDEAVSKVRELFTDRQIEWACFFSPSAVEAFDQVFDLRQCGLRTAVIGTTTASAIRDRGVEPDFISTNASAAEFAAELIKELTN